MPRIVKRIMVTTPFAALVYAVLKLYLITLRLRIDNHDHVLDLLRSGRKVLIVAWHQQFFSAIHHFRGYKKYRPILMISQSRDGELISKIAHWSGWMTARGSSSRGGKTAMQEIISHLDTHLLAAHVVDGPRGPIGIVKPGAVKMAQEAGAVVVHCWVDPDDAWYVSSWDQFMIPKPFSKVRLCYQPGMAIPMTDTAEQFEIQRRRLEEEMRPRLILKYPVPQ